MSPFLGQLLLRSVAAMQLLPAPAIVRKIDCFHSHILMENPLNSSFFRDVIVNERIRELSVYRVAERSPVGVGYAVCRLLLISDRVMTPL